MRISVSVAPMSSMGSAIAAPNKNNVATTGAPMLFKINHIAWLPDSGLPSQGCRPFSEGLLCSD
jgi:hypothetical protein